MEGICNKSYSDSIVANLTHFKITIFSVDQLPLYSFEVISVNVERTI